MLVHRGIAVNRLLGVETDEMHNPLKCRLSFGLYGGFAFPESASAVSAHGGDDPGQERMEAAGAATSLSRVLTRFEPSLPAYTAAKRLAQ